MEEEKFQMSVRRRNFSSFFNLFSLLIRYTICKTFYKNEAITMTDRERIRRIQSGEPEQMNELIEAYYQEIFQYCYSRTGRESAAYDCAQETFLRVIRYLNRYVEQKKFRAYLFGIARSVCIDFFRKKAEAELGYEDGYEERLREEDFADQVSEQVMLQKAMQCLKPEQRWAESKRDCLCNGRKDSNREEQDPPGTEKSENYSEGGRKMISIVSLEIQKILKRKFILILLAIYSAILLFMAYAGHPDRYTPILTSDGKVLEGTEAVQYEKKLAEKYDTLSDADVQEILAENARILAEYTDENQMIGDDYYRYANGFYGAVASVFTDENGNYNHLPADQVYPGQDGLMQGGFTNGMDMLLSFLASFLLLAPLLLIVMISPVFAEEYTSGMDSLILSSRFGKTRCARAKILASFLCSAGIFAVTSLYLTLLTIGYFGTDGLFVDAHLCATGMIGNAPFDLPYWKAVLILAVMGFAGLLMITGFALAASALGTSSFVSVLVTLAFFALPMFLWGVWDIPWLNHILEMCPVNLLSPAKIFNLPAYEIGTTKIQVYQMGIIAAVCFTPVCAVCSYFGFQKHQVRS